MKYALLAVVPFAMAACSGPSDAQEIAAPTDFMRTISVSGQGAASATPDMATLNFGVMTQGASAADAIAANATSMDAVTKALKKMGVASRDLQTANFYVNPTYRYDERGGSRQQTVTGYQANASLSVRLRDVAKIGAAIDGAAQSGANNFNGLSFGFQNPDEMMNEARRDAVRNAREVAQVMATEAGVTLGRVLTISQVSYNGGGPQPMMMRSEMAMDMSSTPIEAGEGSLAASVQMTFSIK